MGADALYKVMGCNDSRKTADCPCPFCGVCRKGLFLRGKGKLPSPSALVKVSFRDKAEHLLEVKVPFARFQICADQIRKVSLPSLSRSMAADSGAPASYRESLQERPRQS